MPHRILPRFTKTGSEVLDYSVLWANFFSSGEQVNSAFVVAASGLDVSSITNQQSAVTFFLGSGVEKGEYRVDNTIFTNQGRTAIRSFDLAVVAAR